MGSPQAHGRSLFRVFWSHLESFPRIWDRRKLLEAAGSICGVYRGSFSSLWDRRKLTEGNSLKSLKAHIRGKHSLSRSSRPFSQARLPCPAARPGFPVPVISTLQPGPASLSTVHMENDEKMPFGVFATVQGPVKGSETCRRRKCLWGQRAAETILDALSTVHTENNEKTDGKQIFLMPSPR